MVIHPYLEDVMEISGIIAVICLGGSLTLFALCGMLLIPLEKRLHADPSEHHH